MDEMNYQQQALAGATGVEMIVALYDGLIRFLSESLAKVPGILSSETFLLLKTFDKWI